jgi:hypothetical protein
MSGSGIGHRNGRHQLILPLFVLVLVAVLDSLLTDEIHLYLLYLIPLVWISTRATLRQSLVAVAFAFTLWWLAKASRSGDFWGDWYRLWNGMSRLVFFYGVVSLIHYLAVQLREKDQLVTLLRETKDLANPVSGLRRFCRRTGRVQTGTGEWMELRAWLAKDGGVTWMDADSEQMSAIVTSSVSQSDADASPLS